MQHAATIMPDQITGASDLGEKLEQAVHMALNEDPVFLNGRWAFGQTGAPQSHLERNHVRVGDVFLFFGLFASREGQDRHHRIFGYMEVDEVRRLGSQLSESDNPEGFLRRHPHTIGEWNVGGKAKNRAYKPEPKKHIVMSLVERGGEVRSFHVKNATAKTLREVAVKIASRKSYLATDENPAYTKLGKEFDGHGTVNHSANEYARLGGFIHVNSAENYFSIFKRGVIGTYHHISEQHLDRYLAEFDFRYNNLTSAIIMENVRRRPERYRGQASHVPHI
jgi:transposase-like protein